MANVDVPVEEGVGTTDTVRPWVRKDSLLGHWVSYLDPVGVRWRAAKIVEIVDADNVKLVYVDPDGTRVDINGGAAVTRRASLTETDVWRP